MNVILLSDNEIVISYTNVYTMYKENAKQAIFIFIEKFNEKHWGFIIPGIVVAIELMFVLRQ